MPLTEHLYGRISSDMRQALDERARAEGKSVAQLVREFVAQGLRRPPRAERARIAEQIRELGLQ